MLTLGPLKTTGSKRRVSLPRFLREEIAVHLTAYPVRPEGLVFTSPEGEPLRRTTFRRRIWLPAIEAAGVGPLRFHDLRHSHAALLIAQGEHPKVIADRLGHASPTVTMSVYAHLFPGLDEDAAARLDQSRSAVLTDPRRTQSVDNGIRSA